TRYDQIRIHRALVPVDHAVWIDPVIKGPITFANCAGLRLRPFANQGTPLQTEVLPVFNHVVAIIEDAVESLMKMRHMISTVQIVIDKHLPVTVKGIMAAL